MKSAGEAFVVVHSSAYPSFGEYFMNRTLTITSLSASQAFRVAIHSKILVNSSSARLPSAIQSLGPVICCIDQFRSEISKEIWQKKRRNTGYSVRHKNFDTYILWKL